MDPQSPPPAGDVNRGTTFIALAVVFGFLSTATTAIRIGIRALSHQLGWDDLAIVLASSLVAIELVFNGLQYHTGDGRHMYYLTESQVVTTLKWGYVTEFFLFLIICFTKISICLFVLRIKKTGWLKWCLYTLMGGLVITTLVCEVILFAQCRPIHAFWDRKSGTCWDPVIYNDAIWAQVAYSIFSDLACSFLPVVVLWRVQIATHLKVGVCGLMSLGLLATASAAVRASLSTNDESTDLTWSLITISDWGCLEENLGIIGANLALSRAAYTFLRNGLRSATGKHSYQYENTYTQRQPAVKGRRGRGLSLSSRSQDSVIHLEESTIKKTTELSVTNKPRNTSAERAASLGFGNHAYTVEDQV